MRKTAKTMDDYNDDDFQHNFAFDRGIDIVSEAFTKTC